MSFDYAPFYCEENIYRLARARSEAIDHSSNASVIFISNEARTVLFLRQKAGSDPHGLVVWDYHVVYEEDGRLFDVDTRLSCPVDRRPWIEATFPGSILAARTEFAPRFVIVPAADFIRSFSSDRRHMCAPDGTFRKPPPEWAPPYAAERGHNLDDFIDGSHAAVTGVLDLASIRDAWS